MTAAPGFDFTRRALALRDGFARGGQARFRGLLGYPARVRPA
jgi:hypothetical protein